MNKKIIKSVMLIGFFVNTYLCAMEQLSSNLNQLTQQLKTLQEMLSQLPEIQSPPPVNRNIKKLIKNGQEVATIDIKDIEPILYVETFKDIIEENTKADKETIIAIISQPPATNYYIFEAYTLLKSFFGDNYLNPQRSHDNSGNLLQKNPGHNPGYYDPRHNPEWIQAKNPLTNQPITAPIEFYIIGDIDDPTFEYLGNDKELYGYQQQTNKVLRNVIEANKPD
ncbi:MAG: hypothetical protein WDZ41_02190 [Candidatus Babeliales bacterium]